MKQARTISHSFRYNCTRMHPAPRAKGHFQAPTQRVPSGSPLQHEVMHPAVALAEHFTSSSSISCQLLSRHREAFSGGAQGRIGIADLLKRAASRAAIEFARLLFDAQAPPSR